MKTFLLGFLLFFPTIVSANQSYKPIQNLVQICNGIESALVNSWNNWQSTQLQINQVLRSSSQPGYKLKQNAQNARNDFQYWTDMSGKLNCFARLENDSASAVANTESNSHSETIDQDLFKKQIIDELIKILGQNAIDK